MRPLLAWLAFVALLVAWQIGSVAGVVSPLTLPSPAADRHRDRRPGDERRALGSPRRVGRADRRWLRARILDRAGRRPADRDLHGVALDRVAGGRGALPDPKIALLPLFILWFGIGEWSKILTIAFGVFFPARSPPTARSTRCRAIWCAWGRASVSARGHHHQDPPSRRAARDPLRRAHRDLDRAHPGGGGRDDRRRAGHRGADPHLGTSDDDR